MAARRYEISLGELKLNTVFECSARVKYFSTREVKFCFSIRPGNVLLII